MNRMTYQEAGKKIGDVIVAFAKSWRGNANRETAKEYLNELAQLIRYLDNLLEALEAEYIEMTHQTDKTSTK